MAELVDAIKQKDTDRAREIAKQDPAAASERDEQGVPAYLLALYYGNEQLAEQLLPADDELDVFSAAAFGRTERLRRLLDEDPPRANAFAEDGFHPLGLACFFGRVDAAKLLVERGADVNLLARHQLIKTAALHAATAAEVEPATRSELAELLLDHGADPNLPQGDGFRPIDAARQNGDERLERLLIERGADPAPRTAPASVDR